MNHPKGSAAVSVAYVLYIFPVLSETVVVNELLTLRELGAQVRILSWARPEGKEFYTITDTQHAMTASLRPLVAYLEGTRFPRTEVLAANARLARRRGVQAYRDAYRLADQYRLLGGWRSFARFAVWGDRLLEAGVQHLHAHFATEATAVAHTLSTLTGLPFSFTAHAHDIYRTPQWLGEKMRAASFVATVCEANRQHLLTVYPDVLAEKVRIIRPGVNPAVFTPPQRSRQDGFRIVSVGRLVRTKGYVDLVAACHELRTRGIEVECLIAGEGRDRGEIAEAIERYQLGDRVTLLGALPREEIVPLLDSADLFVLPCCVDPETGDRDGMPLVLAEAMATGLPVVSTAVSGIPELVRDGAGCIVPERDVVALSEAIERVYRLTPAERSIKGRVGRQIVATEFDLKLETRKLLGLFQGLSDAGIPDRDAVLPGD
ncbi:MAG TPA: glycosyltransferase [Chloroflexota bacterium]|nr:glycosyltransferase [Chloroflexota bacterium]